MNVPFTFNFHYYGASVNRRLQYPEWAIYFGVRLLVVVARNRIGTRFFKIGI